MTEAPMTIFDRMSWLIAFRSLRQHRLRSPLLGAAVAGVTALLVTVTGMHVGIRSTGLVSATTLMSGQVNASGFYKASAIQSAPVVTGYTRVRNVIEAEVPQLDSVVQRGRGWAKLVSDRGSAQVGIGGIDAVAPNIGMLGSWNVFVNDQGLRRPYQLDDETTGALRSYLKDIDPVKLVQERLRVALGRAGYELMDSDPRPFWMKFDAVNRENSTGQLLDVTTWEEETSFVQWIVTALTVVATMVIALLVAIIGVGFMNVTWISIRERTREIGTLRAVGMQRTSVLALFVAEGFWLGLLGTMSGAVLGLLTSWGLGAANVSLPKSWQVVFFSGRLVASPTAIRVLFSVGFVTIAITAISIIPSFLAARIQPVTAMGHVG
jgi:ABC-type antimicrobial peptide transport system permease subunit